MDKNWLTKRVKMAFSEREKKTLAFRKSFDVTKKKEVDKLLVHGS